MIKIKYITSFKNPIIKEIKALEKRKYRWEKKLFLLEGTTLIREAINSNLRLKYIFYSDNLLSTREGVEFFEDFSTVINFTRTTKEIFKEISTTESPQGIIGVGEFQVNDIKNIAKDEKSFYIFLDEIQDPGNMGTIIRSGEAFAISGLIIGQGCVDPYNSKVVRASMGSIFRLPLYFTDNNIKFLEEMREAKFQLLATNLEGEPNKSWELEDRTIIILGNEASGVDKDILSMVDKSIRIAMLGETESLNVGVAASIIMYEAMKGRILEL